MVAQCDSLKSRGDREEVVPAADIADATSAAMAAIASEAVCCWYCTAIWCVCATKEENRVTCGADVINAVLTMMEAHTASLRVQEEACGALWKLAENGECAAHMTAGGRAAALLRLAKAVHPHDKHLQNVIACALHKLGA